MAPGERPEVVSGGRRRATSSAASAASSPAPGVAGRAARFLISLVPADAKDLGLLRRKVAYDRLVLVAGPDEQGLATAVIDEERMVSGAPQHDVAPSADTPSREPLLVVLPDPGYATAEKVLDDLVTNIRKQGGRPIVNVAGGNAAVAAAAIMLVFREGLRGVAAQEGRLVELPVMHGLTVQDRLGPAERAMLCVFDQAPAAEASRTRADGKDVWLTIDLAATAGQPREVAERALRGLRDRGLVRFHLDQGKLYAARSPAGDNVARHVRVDLD